MKEIILATLAAGLFSAGTAAAQDNLKKQEKFMEEKLELTQEWDKVFPKSDKVKHCKITFHNRYGITLAADLYIPQNAAGRLPAIAVSGPFGAVKEQASGLYAQTLAERGFLTIAFDPSFTGESGGQPRYVASPDINTEDFSAAVDYLSTRPDVDPERIGILGICGWGGLAINAAALDPRIKATAAIVSENLCPESIPAETNSLSSSPSASPILETAPSAITVPVKARQNPKPARIHHKLIIFKILNKYLTKSCRNGSLVERAKSYPAKVQNRHPSGTLSEKALPHSKRTPACRFPHHLCLCLAIATIHEPTSPTSSPRTYCSPGSHRPPG